MTYIIYCSMDRNIFGGIAEQGDNRTKFFFFSFCSAKMRCNEIQWMMYVAAFLQ